MPIPAILDGHLTLPVIGSPWDLGSALRHGAKRLSAFAEFRSRQAQVLRHALSGGRTRAGACGRARPRQSPRRPLHLAIGQHRVVVFLGRCIAAVSRV